MQVIKKMIVAGLIAASAGCANMGPPTPIRTIVFPGGFNWPLWVAEEKGLFRANGVQVTVTPTPDSEFQMGGLVRGQFDIAMTAIDNVIAYREGFGAAPVIGHDLFAFMGGDTGFLRFVTTPEVKTFADVKGKTLSVDALTTGYAFVLMEMLARNGLTLDRDYKTERAGGVLQRFQSLMEKKQAGTLLVTPFELQAQARGFNVLADGLGTLGRYQGLVGATRRSWSDHNERALVGYIRAYSDAIEWLYDARNREEAIGIFLKNLPNANRQAAEGAYGALLSPKEGFQRKASIDLEGVKTVMTLRTKFGEPKKLGEASRYYDPRYYNQAMQR